MRFVAVLPSIHPPYTQACLAGMHPSLREHLVLVDNTARNRGLAASWNVGAQRVLDEGADWLVIVSAATRFGLPGGSDLLDLLAETDPVRTWVVEADAPVNQHFWAWSRHLIEGVGLVDRNFYPIYLDEADLCRRVHVARTEGWGGDWEKRPVDAWVAMVGHATKLARVRYDWDRSLAYFVAKWGGPSGQETHARPFDDPALPLSWWPRPPDPRAVEHEGWAIDEEETSA